MKIKSWAPERLVNTYTAGDQIESTVAALANGGYVIVRRRPDYRLKPGKPVRPA